MPSTFLRNDSVHIIKVKTGQFKSSKQWSEETNVNKHARDDKHRSYKLRKALSYFLKIRTAFNVVQSGICLAEHERRLSVNNRNIELLDLSINTLTDCIAK